MDEQCDIDGGDGVEVAATDEDDAAEVATTDGSGGRPCPVCDRAMTHRHCKYVCPEHGVVYDCADTFY